MTPKKLDLDKAYALKTTEEGLEFYGKHARDYDEGFAAETGYVYPAEVAREFLACAGPDDRPVLDIGAGTGLLAESLGGVETDALDISAEMLEVAGAKGLYRNLITANLDHKLPVGDASYGALVSSGTFTHGHVGPACLPELMRIARPGALFCLGINPAVFDSAGFGSALALLVAGGSIGPLDFHAVRLFEGGDHPHANDPGFVVLFRRR